VSFLRAHACTTRELSARLEAAHGLTLNDYDVLVQLAYAPCRQLRRVDLARSVLLSPSGITRLLDGLEREGWVEKGHCASDARVTYAVLTDSGLAKFKAVRKTHLVDIEAVFGSRFSREELETVSSLLGRLLDSNDAAQCLEEPA
jgi:DNA-binding MarR family transcriptional regulator